jgi:adenylate cyclase
LTSIEPENEGSPPQRSVLVVDDQQTLRELVKTALKRRKLVVDAAPDGLAAIEKLRQHEYRVLALDLMMPVVSGWDVLEWLKQHPDRKPHSVIVVSATDREVMNRLDPGVVNAIIFKPFDVIELSAYIAACSRVASADRRRKRVVATSV